jgi:hypothetical protein
MNADAKDPDVGYRRPPKSYQWKKGQSGNPRKIRGNTSKQIWQIVEDVLAMNIAITEGGVKRSGTLFEAITLQLWMKTTAGSKRALNVLRKYEAFAKAKPSTRVAAPLDTDAAAEEYRQLVREL